MRELELDDYKKGIMELMGQMTHIDAHHTYDQFAIFYENYKRQSSLIIVEEVDGKIVATGKIIIEPKMSYGFRKVGHIEDIVVDDKYRGKGYGRKIVDFLVGYGICNNCYKIILNCSDDNVAFYSKCGFVRKCNQMSMLVPKMSMI